MLKGWRGIYVSVNLVIIDLDFNLAPIQCQAIPWTNDGVLFVEPVAANFSDI